jgi:hypothetical protein
MDEAALQSRLTAIIDGPGLLSVVVNRDTPYEALDAARSDLCFPRLPVDSLCRLRTAEAAAFVLKRTGTLERVSTSAASISLTAGEALYPDLLYCSPEFGAFLLFELKRGTATPRQAITELLAYEHEVLNHAPFLSHDDLMMVLVATDFPVLLDHALVGLMTWTRRRVLCLKAEPHGDSIRLAVHLPMAWSPLAQGILPPDALQTAGLCLYPKPDDPRTDDELLELAVSAAQLITREADRAGSHGFVMVWRDAMYPVISQCPLILTVGVVNPYVFLQAATQKGRMPVAATPLSTYLLDGGHCDELAGAWNWNETVGRRAVEYLSRWCEPMWEDFGTWAGARQPDRLNGPPDVLERRAWPMHFDFWGVLGDYARELTARVAMRANFLPSTVRPGIDWTRPRLAVSILDGFALPEVVPGGQWTFGAMLQLGLRLGRLGSFIETWRANAPNPRRSLAAMLFWAEMDLWAPLHELQSRYQSAEDLTEPPPALVFGDYASPAPGHDAIRDLIAWISRHFIGDRSELLAGAFALGLRSHSLLDGLFALGADSQSRGALLHEVADQSRNVLALCVAGILETPRGP